MKVTDVMLRSYPTVTPRTRVHEAASILAREEVPAVPVVDNEGLLVGLLKESDLLPKSKGVPFSLDRLPALSGTFVDENNLETVFSEMKGLQVSEVMSSPGETVSPDEDIAVASISMRENGTGMVCVVEDGRLVGVVEGLKLIRTLLAASPSDNISSRLRGS